MPHLFYGLVGQWGVLPGGFTPPFVPLWEQCCQLSESVHPKAPSQKEHHRHSLRSLPSEARLREYTGSSQLIDSLRPFGAPPSVREALGGCNSKGSLPEGAPQAFPSVTAERSQAEGVYRKCPAHRLPPPLRGTSLGEGGFGLVRHWRGCACWRVYSPCLFLHPAGGLVGDFR